MGTTNNIKIRFIWKDEVQKNSYKMQKGFVCTQSHTNKIKSKHCCSGLGSLSPMTFSHLHCNFECWTLATN